MVRVLLYLFLILVCSCTTPQKSFPRVFLSGEIVNPTSENIVLFKGDMVVDSVKLDDNNRFSFQFDSITEGLYHFKHAPEQQYVYLENGDSLLIRLNTMYFDESLVFEGIGSEINNFLLELFLANEQEESDVDSWYELEADEFVKRVDELQENKFTILKELITEGNLSQNQRNLAKASVIYNYNTYKEQYPFRHRKFSQHDIREKLPENFYAYRKSIDYGNSNLTYLRPYYQFMLNHIQNLSFMSCDADCETEKIKTKNQLHFNEHKLHLIDSLVKEKELKDNLYRSVATEYLLKTHDYAENNKQFITKFHELSKNNRHLSEIDALYKRIENLQPQQSVPELYLANVMGDTVSLREISKEGKTIFYFWSGVNKRHFDNISTRVTKLSKEKPAYNFVGINIRTTEGTWKGMLQNSGLYTTPQYRAINSEELGKTLTVNQANKCIITEDGRIVNAFSNIYASL